MLKDLESTLNSLASLVNDASAADFADELAARDRPQRAQLLLEKTGLSEDALLEALSKKFGIDAVLTPALIENPQAALPIRLITEYQCLPVAATEAYIELVSALPPDIDMNKWAEAVTGKRVIWKLGPAIKIMEAISEKFGVGAGSLSEGDMQDFASDGDADVEEDENAAIIKFVNEIITRAMSDRATDIHIEPQKESLNIRYRIDGNLVPVRVPDNLLKFKDAIISRIKIMARLNISEKRRPQDGRIGFNMKGGEEIDIRISSLPTMYGESISLRLLSKKTQPVGIEDLGFLPEDVEKISKPLARPHGIILVTGPTGSGKSTTLTAFIRKLRSPEIRIITVEDPVEYEVEGVNQTQVHPEIGLTFSSVLRSVLRQDPDVIMVGEIRDRETADIAIRASLTGHLVLSTLHTNDAAGALTRLIDMDIEPFLIASSVEMILAQRLVRRLCICKAPALYEAGYLESCLNSLGIDAAEISHTSGICKPVGCQLCRGIGYHGRLGIFEILLMNEDLHDCILNRKTAREIRVVGQAHGMRSLQRCGWEILKQGRTGLEEIMHYASITEDAIPQ